jgi:catechol 2,3-dioxygenase-like lactoylglutathione lyase family enzyme/ketosteroid isomerase-like protein
MRIRLFVRAVSVVALVTAVTLPLIAEAQVKQVKRPTLMVGDLERSLAVYRDILGFEVFKISGDEKDPPPQAGEDLSNAYEYFSIDPKAFNYTRFATLNTPSQTRALGLIEIKGKLRQPVPRMSTVVLEVANVHRVARKLRARGLRVFPKSEAVTPEGVRFVELPFRDPDGHVIVMYHLERPRGRTAGKQDPTRTLRVGKRAFSALRRGLETGRWKRFLAMLHSDFTFHFPVGSWQGQHRGKKKAAEFFRFVSTIYPKGLKVDLSKVAADGQTVIFEFRDEGELVLPNAAPRPYENRVVISMDVCGDKICRYREYFGSDGKAD